MKKPTLLILAAGFGSRYGGLKQIDPVGPNGETIMDYSIYDAVKAGFGKLVFVIRRDIEEPFRKIIGSRYEKWIGVDYVFQELDQLPIGYSVPKNRKKPWGTGHAILMGAESISEPFAVINADDFYGAQSFDVLSKHLSSGTPDYAMVGFVLNNTLSEFGSVARGICQVGMGALLVSVKEMSGVKKEGATVECTDAVGIQHRLNGREIVSMNMWGFTPTIFGHLHSGFMRFLEKSIQEEKSEFYIPSVVHDLASAGQEKIKVLHSADSWFGITYREDRVRVVNGIKHLVADGSYPKILWK
jgi:UTP-glucose-1-phosphate uridylyltransferase